MSDTGRAGRMRVERRLRTARHGAALLDRKRRIMTDHLDRLQERTERLDLQWQALARDAAAWQRRASALDGQDGIRRAAPTAPAEVTVTWGGALGVAHPVDATCTDPPAPGAGGSSALTRAASAHRDALAAGVRLAAARRAVELVQAELDATRARQRAVENRWVPRLEEELAVIRRLLDEQDLEEALRLRWAAGTRR